MGTNLLQYSDYLLKMAKECTQVQQRTAHQVYWVHWQIVQLRQVKPETGSKMQTQTNPTIKCFDFPKKL